MPSRHPASIEPFVPRTVLHVATERGWRGGERQVLWLARALEAMGHRSVVVARGGEPLAERAREAGLEVVTLAPRTEFDPIAVALLRRAALRYDADVVHAHTGHAVGLAALARVGARARMVVTRRVDFALKRNVASRWKYRRADAIIAISHAVADIMVAGGVHRSRITIVPSGIDLTRRIVPAAPEVLESLGVPRGAPVVVQVAQLVGHKDPVNFVRGLAAARRRVPSLHGLMLGEGPLRGEVEAEATRLGVRDALHLPGYRTDADSILAAATVATLSSREEGLGTVLLDALSLGRPVAACAAGGIPEIIEDGTSGLLEPRENGDALGAAIARLIEDPALAARLGEGARHRAAEFSVERTAARTLEVYERVLGGWRAPVSESADAAAAEPA